MKRFLFSLLISGLSLLIGCQAKASMSVPVSSAESTMTGTPSPSSTPSPEPTMAPTPEPTPSPTPVPPLYGIVIGIDPGHQLQYNTEHEPISPNSSKTKIKTAGGTRGIVSGVYEYEINLAVGLLVRDILENRGATVYLTHDTLDVDMSNIQRADFFNEKNVDLAVRLHCNKDSDKKATGAFMLVPGEDCTNWYDRNLLAAKCIIDQYCSHTGIPQKFPKINSITVRGDQTCFNWCTRPICTIEMGQLSNREEDLLLSDPQNQILMAEGIAMGIEKYFSEIAVCLPEVP